MFEDGRVINETFVEEQNGLDIVKKNDSINDTDYQVVCLPKVNCSIVKDNVQSGSIFGTRCCFQFVSSQYEPMKLIDALTNGPTDIGFIKWWNHCDSQKPFDELGFLVRYYCTIVK